MKRIHGNTDWKGKLMKFKVGDRVAYYGPRGREIGVVSMSASKFDGMMRVQIKGLGEVCAHPKACRRIKPH